MRLRSEIKVGIIVTAGILALIGIYWFLGGLGLYPLYAVFPTAQKLDKGALVRMAGVKIGMVTSTGLTRDNKARVDLRIDNGISISTDSVARVTTGAFIGDFYVEISPGKREAMLKGGDRIRTGTFAQPDKILQQVSEILKELRTSTRGLNQILGDEDILATVKQTVEAMRQASTEASRLAVAANGIVSGAAPDVARILKNLDNATLGATRISSQLEDMVATEVRPNVRATLEQARQTTQKLDAAIMQAQELIAGFKGSTGTLETTLGSVSQTAAEAKDLMANLKEASAGARSIATDEQLRQDIKAAVHNAAIASEQLKDLTEALNKKYGQGRNTPAQRSAVPESGFVTNALWNTDCGDYRVDANYTLPWAGNSFYRAGVRDIGEDTGANLQAGRTFGPTSVRYGLYASRLGVGVDRQVSKSLLISGDVFRPNRPEMELRGILQTGGSVGIYGGVHDLFHGSDRDVYVGIRYQQR